LEHHFNEISEKNLGRILDKIADIKFPPPVPVPAPPPVNNDVLVKDIALLVNKASVAAGQSNDALIKDIALLELTKLIRQNSTGSIYHDLFNYFDYIKDGQHIWFVNLILSIEVLCVDSSVNFYHFHHKQIVQKMNSTFHAEAFIDLLNKKYLFPVEREITSLHGIMRTFRFFTDEQKQQHIKDVCDLVVLLQDCSEYVFLGYGSVLGALRDGRLIDHDDDLDIVVGFHQERAATASDAQKILMEFLGTRFKTFQPPDLDNHIHVYLGNKKCDVFGGLIRDGRLYCNPAALKGIPIADIFPTQMIQLEGIACPMPANAERYLTLVYGESWPVPQKNYTYSW